MRMSGIERRGEAMGKVSKNLTAQIAVRFAIPLLVTLTAVALVACDSGGDGAASPVPLAQRFPTAADAPGTKPDPVEKGQLTVALDEFIADPDPFVDPDREEMTTVFHEAGFKGAGTEARFFGETHTRTAPHLFSSIIELESEDGARSALDWLETDSMKPCPLSCAVQISTFDVDGIADARGVRRLATAKDIESFGTPDQRPSDSYWIGFIAGSFVYAVELQGLPGSVSEEQAQRIASAYYHRLTGI
jgi:hypothetical protein